MQVPVKKTNKIEFLKLSNERCICSYFKISYGWEIMKIYGMFIEKYKYKKIFK